MIEFFRLGPPSGLRLVPGYGFAINLCGAIGFFFHEHFEHRAAQFRPMDQSAVESIRSYQGCFETKLVEKNLRFLHARKSEFTWLVEHVEDYGWGKAS